MLSELALELPNKYRNYVGVYRDDGLAAFDEPPRNIETIKKTICKVLKDNNLRITFKANKKKKKKTINYFDVTSDLGTGTFRPYTEPNNDTATIHCQLSRINQLELTPWDQHKTFQHIFWQGLIRRNYRTIPEGPPK